MRDGLIKVAAGTPKIRVADCRYNAEQVFTLMREADKQGVKVLCLPELCLTGYTCGDLFLHDTLLKGAEDALQTVLEATRNLEVITAVGLPVRGEYDNKLYNCAAVIQKGEILGLVPKVHIPNYGEFYEGRWFASGAEVDTMVSLCGQQVSMSANETFACQEVPNLILGVEICEDLWAPEPPSAGLARSGATIILNLSASNETVGKAAYRRQLVTGQSGRLVCGYIYADAGEGESTTDLVFAGHNMIAENGSLLAERRFANGLTISEIDVDRLAYERRRMTSYTPDPKKEYWRSDFSLTLEKTRLTRFVSPTPFVPQDAGDRAERCNEILYIAALGLKKAPGAHPRQDGGGGPVRRPGFHPGGAHYGGGHADAGPPRQRHHCRHHALLRHHRPHQVQRRAPGRGTGLHPAHHRHRQRGKSPLQGHRPEHGGPLRHL